MKTKAEIDFYIGQLVQVKENIEPESEFWEKGYWVIPKGHKCVVLDTLEDGECLIEYIEAAFYVDPDLLMPA